MLQQSRADALHNSPRRRNARPVLAAAMVRAVTARAGSEHTSGLCKDWSNKGNPRSLLKRFQRN
jgi:hypothetical protein